MNWWTEWRRGLKRAKMWDAPGPGDPKIISLKKMFRSAWAEDADIGDRIWRNIRPRLHALGETPFSPASLWPALAMAGPRFAVGATCAFLIMAGVFLTRAGEAPRVEMAALSPVPIMAEAPPPSPEEYPIQALQSNNGDELLQFIAYGSPSR